MWSGNLQTFWETLFFCLQKRTKSLPSSVFVRFNSWPVILTALPAVMVAFRKCERSWLFTMNACLFLCSQLKLQLDHEAFFPPLTRLKKWMGGS